jgi:hypothetical protein
MALTSTDMRALRLREVNWREGRIRKDHLHECIAEDGSDLADGFIERGIAFAHERSPWKTTHDDLRSAVETPSGGGDQRGVVPRSLTMYAAQFENVRPGVAPILPLPRG